MNATGSILSVALVVPENLNVRFLESQTTVGAKFLNAIGATPDLFIAMEVKGGYTMAEHNRGWRLLRACSTPPSKRGAPPQTNTVVGAREELSRRRRSLFMRVKAALQGKFPEQHAYVLDGLPAEADVGAALSIEALLDRIDQLGAAPDRKDTRKTDAAAITYLTARGVTAGMRKQLRSLIHAFKNPDIEAPPPDDSDAKQERIDRLYAFYVWLREWRGMARAVLERRDYLVRLGIAKQKPPRITAPKPATVPAIERAPDSRAA